jgi:predicted peptidase
MAQVARRFGEGRASLDCLIHVPVGEPSVRWPMLFFLHGAGECGDEIESVKTHGVPRIAEANPSLPFVAVSPQCPGDRPWTKMTDVLFEILEQACRELPVDPSRIYLTGISMGGFGTWKLAAEYPDRFAAIAPICGGGDPAWAPKLARLPIWAFHGDADTIVPVDATLRMIRALDAVGAPARLTIYPGVGHDSWSATYADSDLYRWFLSHQLSR